MRTCFQHNLAAWLREHSVATSVVCSKSLPGGWQLRWGCSGQHRRLVKSSYMQGGHALLSKQLWRGRRGAAGAAWQLERGRHGMLENRAGGF